ncbi:MAG TPA: IclR family transcriptional regulator [Burkholderiales bacterium]|nr:IclR family transcriptional regulator [Burkholderiales bacterium]
MPQKEDRTPATLRAFAVLEALAAADQPATLARLVESCKLPKPTVYRMLAMLEQAGLVWREPASRGYTPGPRLAALGRDVMLNGSLRAERHSILARLVEVIGETCNFTMLDGAEVVYLDRVEAAWPLRVTLSPGSHVPLHCTASGKLLLALLPKAARTRLLAHLALSRHTDTTITDGKRLAAELAQIRASRFATDNEEYHAGLVCVAVPVMDARRRACAAIAVQALASRMPLRRALEHLPVLRSAADAMAATVAEKPA